VRYVLVGLLVIIVYIALRFAANSAVYYPLRYPDGLWNLQRDLAAAEVWLTARDGVKLNAWWIAAPGARLATVFFHGNGGNLTHRIEHMRAIVAAGSSLLMLDYRGYGKSEGKPSEAGLYMDADAAYQWLIDQGHTRIVIQGESLGSAVAVDLAARKPCVGVVLEAPFNSASQVAAGILPVLGPLIMRGFDSKRKIGSVRAPLLFMQGDRDEVIPYKLGQDLYAASPEPKSFWTVEGAGHNDLIEVAGERYREHLAAFYASLRGADGLAVCP
jgi:fermentation-respiration switch protein FrsA (DUF1100 family)